MKPLYRITHIPTLATYTHKVDTNFLTYLNSNNPSFWCVGREIIFSSRNEISDSLRYIIENIHKGQCGKFSEHKHEFMIEEIEDETSI